MIPGARFHMVQGGGHLFLIDRSIDATAAVTAFLGERA
jgi:hypothetical protein